jgi:hypothetical protein
LYRINYNSTRDSYTLSVNISSPLEVCIALNFAYAFVRSLADYELNKRLALINKYKTIFDGNASVEQRKRNDNKFELKYERCIFGLDGVTDIIKNRVKTAIIVCLSTGVFSIILLINISFDFIALNDVFSLFFVIFSCFSPVFWALHLWRFSTGTLKPTDKMISELRDLTLENNR